MSFGRFHDGSFAPERAVRRFDRKVRCLAAALTVSTAALVAGTGQARAEGPVDSRPKGIIGGGLLGAEVVMITMGAIGVEKGWPYIVFGIVGAAGGAIGGFFVEEASGVDAAEAPTYMLAGGMALVIPTMIVTLNATAYKPPADDKGEPVDNKPAVEPAPPGGSVTVTTSKSAPPPRAMGGSASMSKTPPPAARLPHVPLSLVDLHEGQLALGFPAPEVRAMYTRREMIEYGVEQQTVVRVPIFKASF
jgi:hypothetical protein